MPAPSYIRSTAGFRAITMYELYASGSVAVGLPMGAKTLEPFTIFPINGSFIQSGSPALAVPVGTTVAGSVAYYGIVATGAKILTLNDPAPRVIPHIGDDGVVTLQILPPQEPVSGELRMDKTNDILDAIAGNINKIVIGETNIFGQSTNKRGFELQLGIIAYAYGQDTDPNSATFGINVWDFRIMPKTVVFQRDTGYAQEANERLYTVAPMYVTSHIWGTQFTNATEGFVRAQLLRGVGQYKPVLCSFMGDGSALGFCFDTSRPAATTAKISVWKNGTLQGATVNKQLYGVGFNAAPLTTDLITVYYETV